MIAENSYLYGLITAVITAVTYSVSAVATRLIKEIHFSLIQFYYAVTSTTITGLCVIFQPSDGRFQYDSWVVWMEIGIVCVCNMVMQNMITCMNQSANPAIVSLMCYIQLIYSFFVDLVIFKLSFMPLELVGVLICFTASITGALLKIYEQNAKHEYVKAEPCEKQITSENMDSQEQKTDRA